MKDQVDKLKNIFNGFKILAAKVNDDNKNKKKKLDETKELLEICKKEYQKLYFEHENLRKNMMIWYNNIIGREKQLIRAKERKIVVPEDSEETESEKLDGERRTN